MIEIAAYRFVSFDVMENDVVVFPKARFPFQKKDIYLEDALVTTDSVRTLLSKVFSELESKGVKAEEQLSESLQKEIAKLMSL